MRKGYLIFTFLTFFSFLQLNVFGQASVKGMLKGVAGEPLIGANVAVKGTNNATISDENGNFMLEDVPLGAQTLEISYVGFQTLYKEVEVGADGISNLELSVSTVDNAIDEVVVIGYGSALKKDLTGSVATVSQKEFNKGTIISADQLIAGKLAGVQVQSNGGRPGSGSTIRIRGGASLNASNDPLIVIDGVPVSNDNISGVSSPLSMINPNEIETFTVLKDASAAAIYGARASNGVILITTKKGTGGKPKFNFTTALSFGNIAKKADVLSANEFRTFVNQKGNDAQKALLGQTTSTDWQDLIYQTAVGSDNILSMGGVVGNMPYRMNLGYLNQSGILQTDKISRGTFGLNLSPKFFNDALSTEVSLKYSNSKSRFAPQGAIGSAYRFDPTKPETSGSNRFNGYWEWLDPSSTFGLKALAPRNPVGTLKAENNTGKVVRVIGNIAFDYNLPFVKGLSTKLNLGLDNANGNGFIEINDSAAGNYNRYKDAANKLHGGAKNKYAQDLSNKLLEYTIKYARNLTSDIKFDVLGGYSYQDFKTKNYFFSDYTYDGTATSNTDFNFDIPRNVLISYFGRLNFNLYEKYLVTATLRRDGSSRFSEDNRWGLFPSVAVAWRLKEESFLKNVDLFSDLKLRMGWGITGQQDGIGNYSYLPNYSLGNQTAQYQFGSTYYQVYRPAGYNPNIKWEQTQTFNIGLDFGFLQNRINGSLDYYDRKTEDLLNKITQSAGTNFSNQIVANVGNMINQGVELNLNTLVLNRPNLTWNLGGNVSYNKNEITNLTAISDPTYPGNQYGDISGGTGNTVQINSVGYPRGSYYVYQQVYNSEGVPVDNVFVDKNGDNSLSDKDLYRFKSVDPNWLFGITTSVQLNKMTLGTTLRGTAGNYLYNNVISSTGTVRNILDPLGYLANGSSDVLTNKMSGNGDKYFLSDYFVENASFLRMDNFFVGYNFGNLICKKTNLNASASVQNAFLITKYKGVDPEINNGIDNNFYPRPRTYSISLSLDF